MTVTPSVSAVMPALGHAVLSSWIAFLISLRKFCRASLESNALVVKLAAIMSQVKV